MPFVLLPHATFFPTILCSWAWPYDGFSTVTCKVMSWEWFPEEFLLFLIFCALNVDRVPGVTEINLQSEATRMRTESQGF